MKIVLLIGLAGVIGTLSRYFMVRTVNAVFPDYPWGTLGVNIVGAFVAGFFFVLCKSRFSQFEEYFPVLFLGFLGAFTTFSTFTAESIPDCPSMANLLSTCRGFTFSHAKTKLVMWITRQVTIGGVLRVIPISHDEKAARGRETDTPKKGIKRRVFVISIDQSGYEYHKNSEVSPGDRQKRQKNSEFGPILRIIPAKSAA